VTYCIVERRLALRHRRPLRRYEEDSGVQVVAERRDAERRIGEERRTRPLAVPADIDRRRVRPSAGRRVAERRATLLPVHQPAPLPRRLRSHAAGIGFAARLALTPEQVEDIDAARIVVRIQGGDGGLFGLLYERFFDRVYSYASALVEDAGVAEWLTQETFLDLHEDIPAYDVAPTGFRERLAGILWAKAAEHLRRTRGIDLTDANLAEDDTDRVQDGSADALAFPDWVSDTDLQLLIGRLPHPQRQAVMLCYLLDLSEAEAARVCGCLPDVVSELNDRALAHLRGRLALLGREMAVPSMRLSMLRGRRPARVLQGRRLALLSG
jgi:RNA polymerase sigma-70 factor, ECF subfamily